MKQRIYLAGGMTAFVDNEDEAFGWRTDIKDALADECIVVNPVDHFWFDDKDITDREAMNFDLFEVRRSDLIIMNFNDPKSLGTMAELGIAHERRIPVIGLNEHKNDLHPWQIEMTERIFTDREDMLSYIRFHYL